MIRREVIILGALLLAGCASAGRQANVPTPRDRDEVALRAAEDTHDTDSDSAPSRLEEADTPVRLVVDEQSALEVPPEPSGEEQEPEEISDPGDDLTPGDLALVDVLQSVRATYPLLIVAAEQRRIARGEQLEAAGGFDLYLSGEAIAQPQGDYENYRYNAGLRQPLWCGGEVFGGYRLGDGVFEPWYKERETEEGGEFRAGVLYPLAQGRAIDPRRAAVLRAEWTRRAAEPYFRIQLIEAIRAASRGYWEWVASGQAYQISESLLDTAERRAAGLKRQVEAGEVEELALVDNERLIVSRRAKLIEAEQKLRQSSIKLSLFLRTPAGEPVLIDPDALPESFPEPHPPDPDSEQQDIEWALLNRPEVSQLRFERKQMEVEFTATENLLLPSLNTTLAGSQDVGGATNDKDDKGEFLLEGGFLVNVPLQRRSASGKLEAVRGKLAQNTAKLRFAQDKVTTEVSTAHTALAAAYEQYQLAAQAEELNVRMEQAEQRRFELGASDLLVINLREQATADASVAKVGALFAYFAAEADLRAALGLDDP